MLIICPSCKARFSFDDDKVGADGVKLRCSKCRTIFRVVRKGAPAPAVPPEPAAPPQAPVVPPVAVPPPEPQQPVTEMEQIAVVVAHESPAFCTAVRRVLSSEPFQVHTYNDGREAMTAIERLRPAVVLLDVALPSMYGFEVCEEIRKSPLLAEVKIILIASIYDKTRYKRAPQSLYGADDYIEKHHIPDSLAAMIYRLVSGQRPVDAAPAPASGREEVAQSVPEELTRQELASQEATRQEIRQDEVVETSIPPHPAPAELNEAHEKAKRFARIIVSDIILYNQAQVEEGVRAGTFFSILADDIAEGKKLYERRIPKEVRAGTRYLEEAFQDLIAKKKQELEL